MKSIFSPFDCFLYFQHEWRYLLAGGTVKPRDLPNPAPDWLSERSWGEILTLAALPKFADFAEDFSNHLPGFKKLFDSIDPHRSVKFQCFRINNITSKFWFTQFGCKMNVANLTIINLLLAC